MVVGAKYRSVSSPRRALRLVSILVVLLGGGLAGTVLLPLSVGAGEFDGNERVRLAPNRVPADLSGIVVSVLDGDTVEVLDDSRPERIRLYGIDCPEKSQAYGTKAKQATAALAFGKKVTLHARGKDKYGRTIAEVLLPDGTHLNQQLVKYGWCWWYRTYASSDSVLERFEQAAKDAKKGIWADPAPVPPWVYRKATRRH